MRILVFVIFFFSFFAGSLDSWAQTDRTEVKEPSGLRVQFLGISEGESTVVQFPNGNTMLIDSGSSRSGQEVVEWLHHQDVKRINTLVLTGQMEGHIGGTQEILKHFPVEQIILPAPLKGVICKKIGLTTFDKLYLAKEGQIFSFLKDVTLRVLHPGDDLSLTPEGNSLVFQLVHQKIKILFTSDINEVTEQHLLQKYNVKSQILKVSDSGSNQASDPEFLERVDAHAAIVFRDEHHHLSKLVLGRLTETWMDIYQTDKHGTVTVYLNGKSYQIEKQKKKT